MANQPPQLLKGFRDFGPDKMSARLFMFEKIRQAFERFGFEPMDTPALEYAEVLAGKYGAEEKLMYRFTDAGERAVAMRYDLTVPLARFYASNKNDLPKPFKRYAIGPVWRADNPQKGRYREFYQCDVDVVGSASLLADAECIAAVATAIMALGVRNLSIRISNRMILGGIFSTIGISSAQALLVLRVVDKLDKISVKQAKAEVENLGIKAEISDQLFRYLETSFTDVDILQKTFQDKYWGSAVLSQGIKGVSEVYNALPGLGVKNATIDLALARGLDYYTGTVCEIALPDMPDFGSIAGGGRYDNLIGGIVGEKKQVPAVGMSIGIDRLLAVLDELGMQTSGLGGDVIVFNLEPELLQVYLTIVTELRASGLTCDFYYEADSLAKQFRYAEKKQIKLAVIVGADELKSGKVKVKNLSSRKQTTVKAGSLVGEIMKLL